MEAERTFMQIAARYAGLLLLIAVAWAYLWPVLRAILVAFLPDHLCGPGGRVIDTVHDEERRKSFKDLQAGLPGMGTNLLSDRLSRLVDDGILERVPYQERPLRMEYRLTAKGRTLEPILLALRDWGENHA